MDTRKFDPLTPAQEFRRTQARQLHQKLLQANPNADEALLEMFATADSSLLLGHKSNSETPDQASASVHLILDDTRRDAAAIIGTEALLWRDPISKQNRPTWQTQKRPQLIGVEAAVPETETMTQSELKLYWASYFNDPAALDQIVELFVAHQHTDLTELLSVALEPDTPDPEPLNNIHSVGLTAPKGRKLAFARETLKQALRDKIRGALGQAATLPADVQQHQIRGLHARSGWRNQVEHGLKGTEAEIIPFPKPFNPPLAAEVPSNEPNLDSKYHPETAERIGPMFLGIAHYLAHLPENLNWFSGINQALFLPPEITAQYNRLCQAESACHTFRYTAQLESTVAALISYNFPRLVSADAQAKARKINKNEAQHYHPLEAPFEKAETQPMKTFSLDSELAAQHFGSPDGLVVELTLDQIKQVWQLPTSKLITLTINGQTRSLTAGVFRRWFHYQTNPVLATGNTGYLNL